MSEYSPNDRYNRDLETDVFKYLAGVLFLWLLSGFWQLQVRNPEEYEARLDPVAAALEGGKEDMAKAKGVKRSSKTKIPFDRYKSSVVESVAHEVEQYSIMPKNYVNRIVKSRKVAFSSLYDQRYLLCRIHSVPYGSILIRGLKRTGLCFMCDTGTLL